MRVHDQLVAGILATYPDAVASGFKRALGALPDADYIQAQAEDGWLLRLGIIPDAFIIDTANRIITIFEAVVTNDITKEKFARIADLAWALDEDCYALRLVRVDQFGTITTYDPLAAYLVQQLRDDDRWQDLNIEATHSHPFVAQVAAIMPFVSLDMSSLTEGAAA